MKRAVAYCRVSTQGQVGDDAFGIEMQREMIKEYAVKNDIEITTWFIDEAVSGASDKRPAFDRLLSGEVENPPIQYVIVAKTDRISRDINLYYAYKAMLNKLDLEIVSVTEDWTSQDKLTAMILENFLAMSAMVERENIRLRTSGGRREKAKRGGFSGGKAPYGYVVKDGRLEIEPEEAEVVRWIYKLKNDGLKIQAIRVKLNEEGIKTRSGKEWQHSTVTSILSNERTYRGEYRYGEYDWVKGQHEAILKGEE